MCGSSLHPQCMNVNENARQKFCLKTNLFFFVLVFYVKRNSSRGRGPVWSLGQTLFTCPSNDLRDQWVTQLKTALKTHCESVCLVTYQTTTSLMRAKEMYIKLHIRRFPVARLRRFFCGLLSLPGSRRPQRLLVFINPFGGKKKAKQIYQSLVAPLFELAGISSHVVGKLHATPLRYRRCYRVSLSGDTPRAFIEMRNARPGATRATAKNESEEKREKVK